MSDTESKKEDDSLEEHPTQKINGGFYIYDVVKNGNAKSTKIVGIVVFKTHTVKDKNNSNIEEIQMLKLDMDMDNIEIIQKIQNFRDTVTKVDGKEIFRYSEATLQQLIGKSFDPELLHQDFKSTTNTHTGDHNAATHRDDW